MWKSREAAQSLGYSAEELEARVESGELPVKEAGGERQFWLPEEPSLRALVVDLGTELRALRAEVAALRAGLEAAQGAGLEVEERLPPPAAGAWLVGPDDDRPTRKVTPLRGAQTTERPQLGSEAPRHGRGPRLDATSILAELAERGLDLGLDPSEPSESS